MLVRDGRLTEAQLDQALAHQARDGGRLGTVPHAGVNALNEDIVGIVQIESPSAAEAADEIAATDGVDVLFVGPADLSHSLGVPGQFADARYQAALRVLLIYYRSQRSFGEHVAEPRTLQS